MRKREVMKSEFESSAERKNVVDSFKREYRSLKRSERQAVKKQIEKDINEN